MVKMTEFRLTVEVDQEKVDALDAAEDRVRKAYDEFMEAAGDMRRATTELRHSLKVKKDEG